MSSSPACVPVKKLAEKEVEVPCHSSADGRGECPTRESERRPPVRGVNRKYDVAAIEGAVANRRRQIDPDAECAQPLPDRLSAGYAKREITAVGPGAAKAVDRQRNGVDKRADRLLVLYPHRQGNTGSEPGPNVARCFRDGGVGVKHRHGRCVDQRATQPMKAAAMCSGFGTPVAATWNGLR